MDNQRVFVWAALALVLWLNYTDVATRLRAAARTRRCRRQTSAATRTQRRPRKRCRHCPSRHSHALDTASCDASGASSAATPVETADSNAGVVHVTTDVLSIGHQHARRRAGARRSAEVSAGEESARRPGAPVQSDDRRSTSRAPVCVRQTSGLSRITSRCIAATASEYRLKAGEAKLVVPLTWSEGGLTVTKTYTFYPGSVSHRPHLRRQEPVGQRLEGRVVRAARASLRARRALVFQRRDVRLSRPGDLRRQGLSQARTSRTKRIARSRATFTGGWMAALQHHFVAAAVPPRGGDVRLPAQPQRAERLHARRIIGPLMTVPAGGDADVQGNAVRRPEAAGAARRRPGRKLRARRRLRPADDHLAAAVLAARKGARLRAQLGLGDHHRHVPDQARVLQADRGERPLDGEDAQRRAAHQGDPGALQGRSRAARPADDGAVQAREDQSARRLPADPDPDSVLPRVLLGAARERGDAPGAVLRLDHRPVARAIRSSSCRS